MLKINDLTQISFLTVLAIGVLGAIRLVVLFRSVDRRLLKACLGDKGQAERLIQLELSRDPKKSRRAAVATALWRLRRDNH